MSDVNGMSVDRHSGPKTLSRKEKGVLGAVEDKWWSVAWSGRPSVDRLEPGLAHALFGSHNRVDFDCGWKASERVANPGMMIHSAFRSSQVRFFYYIWKNL
jgi:hypothetical protein